MVTRKLREIGQNLNVTDRDIKDIRKAGFTNKIRYWLIGALIALISFIIGFFVGRANCPPCPPGDGGSYPFPSSTPDGGGYPYAAGLVIPVALAGKTRGSKIAIVLISAIAFLVAIKAVPVFGEAIKYNVFNK